MSKLELCNSVVYKFPQMVVDRVNDVPKPPKCNDPTALNHQIPLAPAAHTLLSDLCQQMLSNELRTLQECSVLFKRR